MISKSLLKELESKGFIDQNQLNSPLYQHIIDWFDEKKIFIEPFEEFGFWILLIHHYDDNGNKIEIWKHKGPYESKYDALNIGIEESIKLL